MSESEEYITVCELMAPHGVKGYIKAKPLTYDLNRHEKLSDVMLKKTNGQMVQITLEDSRLINKLWLLKFKGYDTPESVSIFVNGELLISSAERLAPPEGKFFLDDLAGFRVKLENGEIIGEVLYVEELPTVNAFLIKFDTSFQREFSKKNILAPWIDDCILEVNESSKFIVCDKDYLKGLCPEDK